MTDRELLYPKPFTLQIVTNICATLALLGILFNIDGQVDIGEHLTNLKTVLGDVDPVVNIAYNLDHVDGFTHGMIIATWKCSWE